jgi:hypothetical protein
MFSTPLFQPRANPHSLVKDITEVMRQDQNLHQLTNTIRPSIRIVMICSSLQLGNVIQAADPRPNDITAPMFRSSTMADLG